MQATISEQLNLVADRSATHLLEMARQAAPGALGSLLELYRNYLRILAHSQLGHDLAPRANASDVVQETFLEACRDFGQFRGHTPNEFLAWLRKILVRNIATLVEHHLVAQKRDARRAESSERAALVADHLTRLPEQYRDVLVMRHLEECPFEEVGQRMGRTASAARMLWLRAIDRLRQSLRDEGVL